MQSDQGPEPKSVFKNPLLYSSAILVIVLLTIVFVMFSRWQDTRNREQQAAKERAAKQHEQDRAAVEQLGGKDFDIISFYASPGTIHRGESVQLCYGVSNANRVTLEPQPHPVWPSESRCVEVAPAKTTTYTLTIADAAGKTKAQTLEVKVL